ncbi:MAG: hypothetical protein O3C63_01325 [Cyanobacteria bacterium]|nr:hypothetical protein [Cyanobacteriota bacterium]MDA1020723.1 hypothetical protein [Cyanobacteriota bacterium]
MKKLITLFSILLMSATAAQAKHHRSYDQDKYNNRSHKQSYGKSDRDHDHRDLAQSINRSSRRIENNYYGPIISNSQGPRRFNSQTCVRPRRDYYRQAYIYNNPWWGPTLISFVF